MATSAIGLIAKNRQISRIFSARYLQPTLISCISHRNKVTQEPKERAEQVSQQHDDQQSSEEQNFNKEIEVLTGEIKELKEKNVELTDKYKRSLADSENLRNRLTKQIEDAKVFGIQGFCKDLIEVADILESATVSVPKDQVSDKNPHLKNLFEGLTMTTKSLQNVFSRNGLEQVNPINEKFDPNFHEALFQKEDNKVDINTVIEVSKIGYKLRGRCIRPALVGVSRK